MLLQANALHIPLADESVQQPQACQFDDDTHIPRCHTHALSSHGDICRRGLEELRATCEEQARVIGRLREAVTGTLDLLEEAKAQWGEDNLWKKWGMSERIAELKALTTEPTEAI